MDIETLLKNFVKNIEARQRVETPKDKIRTIANPESLKGDYVNPNIIKKPYETITSIK